MNLPSKLFKDHRFTSDRILKFLGPPSHPRVPLLTFFLRENKSVPPYPSPSLVRLYAGLLFTLFGETLFGSHKNVVKENVGSKDEKLVNIYHDIKFKAKGVQTTIIYFYTK